METIKEPDKLKEFQAEVAQLEAQLKMFSTPNP